MTSTRACLFSLILSFTAIGCGGGAPPKEMPKQTPEQKAALDKQHEEMKPKTDAATPPK